MIVLINALMFFGWDMLLPTLPMYIADLGATPVEVGLCTAAATLTSIIIRPFAGLAVDRLGRRGVLYMGFFITAVVLLAYSFSPLVSLVLVVRLLHGFGWGSSTTSSTTIAADVIPKKRFGEGVGFFTLSQSLSLAIGPGVGIALMATAGFRTLTIIAAGTVGLAALLAAFVRCRKIEKKPVKQKFVPYERRSIKPSVLMLCVSSAFGSIIGFISLYGTQRGIENMGLYFTVSAASLLVSRAFIGRLIDRFGMNIAVFPGFALFIASMVMLFAAKSMPVFLAAGLVQGVGYGSVQTSLQTMSLLRAPKGRMGAANATFFTGMDMGTGLGYIVGGALATVFGYGMMYFLMGIPLMAGMVLYFFLLRREANPSRISEPVEELINEDLTI